ncbi:amidase, partial [Staphylococcus lugdunensis]
TTVAYAQEDNGKQTAEKDKKENTSKPIDFDKAQKMSPQALKEQLTPEDLRLHNKVAEHNSNSVVMRSFANRSYQDVNT